MGLIQYLVKKFMPRRWLDSIEEQSREWTVRCYCGNAESLWELGGMRGRSAGETHWFRKCPKCDKRSMNFVTRDAQAHVQRPKQ